MNTWKQLYLTAIKDVDKKLDKCNDMHTVINTVSVGILEAVTKGEFTFAWEGLDAKDGKSHYADVLWSISRKTGCSMPQVSSYLARHFEQQDVVIQEHREYLLFILKDCL